MNKSKFVLFIILLVLVLITIPLVSASVEYGDGWRKICDDSGKCQFSNYHTIQRWDGQYIPYESLDLWGGQWTYYISENATYYDFIRLGEILSLPKSFGSYNFGLNDISFTFTVTPSQLGSISEENGSGVWYIPIPDKAVKTRFIWDDVKPFIYKNSNQSLYLNDSDFWYSKVNDQIRLNYNQNARNFGIASTNITFVFDSWTVGQGGSSWSGNSLRNNTVEDNPLGSIVVGSAYISGLGIPTNIAIYATSGYTPNWTVSSSQISQTTAMSEKSSIYYINGLNLTDMVVLSKVNVLDRESIPNRVGVSARINSTNYSYVGVIRNSSASSLKHLLLAGKDTMSGPNNATLNVMSNTWYDIRLEVQGSQILYFFNDVQILNMTNSNISYGSAGLYCYDSAKCYYKKFRVYPYGQMSGNLTTWYDSLSGNETYQIDVNATTPTNTNYTVWYANNGTGSYSQLGGTLTGNNSLIISGTKYQNTDVQVRLAGNTTATPEIMKVTLFTQSASGGAGDFIPPTPVSCSASTGNFWINTSCSAGTGNVTNGMNKTNGTVWSNNSNFWMNNTRNAHSWDNVSFYAYNNSGNWSLNNIPATLNTQVPNNAPVQAAIGNKQFTAGQLLNFTVSATDADNDTITYGTNASKGNINTLLASDNIKYSNNTEYWMSSSAEMKPTSNLSGLSFGYGSFRITYRDYTLSGNTFTQIYKNNISYGTLHYHPAADPDTVDYTEDFYGQINASDIISVYANNSLVGFGSISLFRLKYDNISSFNWSTTEADVGTYYWNFNSSDSYGGVDDETIMVTVNAGNYIPPTPVISTATQGNFWINTTWSSGSGNITNSYNSTNGTGAWQNTSATFRNTTVSPHGWQNATIYAYNSSGTGTLNATPLTNNTQLINNLPILTSIGSKSVNEGVLLSFTLSGSDADSDALTNSTNRTEGNSAFTGNLFTWTPTYSESGVYIFRFYMNDSYGGSDYEDVQITVNDITLTYMPPTPISLVNTTSNFWVNHTWQAGSGNVTNSYNVSQNGTWTNGSANTFKNVTVGTHGWSNISVYAFNNSGTGTLNQTPVSQNTTVPNNVPILNLIGNHVGMEGNNISFTISGTDADNDSLTCSTTLPYDSISSCTYVWVPNYTASGNYSGNITIQDSYGGSDYETVWVNVSNYSGSIVNVTTSKSIVNVSESFFINITVNPQGGNITGMQTNLEFDETMIRVDNVSEGNLFNQNGAVTTFSPGTINNNTGLVQNIWTVITDAGKAVNQSGTFVTISATAISAGQSGLNFTNLSISNVIIANPASQSVPYNATNGSILVNETSINYIPPTPINCISSNGTSWINVSCLLGIGNITNGMNFTNSTIWSNGTSFFWNNTGLAEGTQYTYHIYAFNNSGAGTLNLTYATVINTTQSTPLVNGSPNITQYWNNINGYNQSAMSINVGNSGTFNVTINQTVDNVSWKVEGAEEQNTSSLQFIRAFNTIGTFNVTAQAFNVNGSSNIIYTVVTVTSTGGGGTDWDYAYGWVNWTNGTMINGASVSTSKGTVYSNAAGYYSFGYVFEHGLSYDFNISKNGILDNKTVSFASGDYQIVNGTLQAPIVNGTPNITSYGNDNTSNATLTLTVPKNTNITFNATSNQTLTSCSWTGATQINCTANTYAYKNFTSTGIQTVSIIGSNVNGSTQTITWTITVTGINNITLSGYVQNSLELKLQNARIDLNSNYTFTDINGYYSFNNINENTYIVLVRAIGYENNSVSIEINSDKIHNFTIKERVWGGTMVTPGFEVILSIIVFLILFVSKNTFIRNKRR